MLNKVKNFFKRNYINKIYLKRAVYNKRYLDAAINDRLTKNWKVPLLHIDNIIRTQQRTLVARSRHECLNNDYAKAFIKISQHNIIGSHGFTLHAKNKTNTNTYNKTINKAIEEAWNEWANNKLNCDIEEQSNFVQLQYNALASAAINGEFFFKITFGANNYGFGLKEIDPQLCDPKHFSFKLKDNKYIKSGIEFNEDGKILNYFFNRQNYTNETYSETTSKLKYNKEVILHGFIKEQTEQKRGLPWTTAALWRLHQLGEFEKSALVNVRDAANNSGFLEWDEGHGPSSYDADKEEVYFKSEPGVYPELPPGLRAKDRNKQYPAGEFVLFHKSMLRGISSGLGVSYNILANDLEGVNYSSLRTGALAEREEYLTKQTWFINCFLNPLFNAWLKYSLLAGKIKANGRTLQPENIEKYNKVEWQGRRWKWVDPVKDINAAVNAKNNLFIPPSQVIKEQGKDPSDIWLTYAKDIEEMKKAGIPDELVNTTLGITQKTETNNN